MKYILIQNEGEIEINSFELIGASTKRNDSTKIGFFGSGLKYSIAYMMRNNISFRVFTGENEIVFTKKPETLRDQSFDRICINGLPTSYTTTMGPTWTEDWFILREIYCNAVDEGKYDIVNNVEEVHPAAGRTRIYIEQTDKLQKVINNWDACFADEREPLFITGNIYTSVLGAKTGRQQMKVYNKTSGVIFRKNIRVHSKDYNFDYGFDDVAINEDRTAQHPSYLSYAIQEAMTSFQNEDWITAILRDGSNDKPGYEYISMCAATWFEATASDKWIEYSKKYLLVVREKAGKYPEIIRQDRRECLTIPYSVAAKIKKDIPAVTILGMGTVIGNSSYEEIERTPKMDFLLKEVLSSLSQMKYHITYDIKIVDFDDDKVLGQASFKDKIILLSNKVFDLGRREIALTLIEETEHIQSGKEDESREFQSHLINRWLTTMENENALFL